MALQKGDKLNNGKYTIEETLKVGRFCITYLATVNSSVPKVVIKTPKDEMYEYVQDIERCNNNLLAEASALSSCKHPHIVKFKKHFTEGEKVYLVMEHIAGDNLANLLETLPDKIMPEPQALTYIKQIGEALTAVHKSELVHRDVKPDNIILRAGKEEAILIGFGLARGLEDILTTVNLTIYDNLDPTIYAFFAPELYGPTTNRGPYTDVYSLAATLYFLLTGQVPPNAQNRHKEKLVAPKKLNSNISDSVNKAINQGMQLNPEDRPQTMAEWLELLPLPAVEKEPESPPSKKEPLKLQDIINLLLAVLAIVVAVLVGLYPQEIREQIQKFFPSPSPTPKSIEEAKGLDRNNSNF